MKYNRLLFIFALLSFTILYAQVNLKELERKDGVWAKIGEKNSYSGEFIETFENGSLQGKGTLKNGTLNGERISYYENGKIKFQRFYKNGITDGKSFENFENGTLKQQGIFKNGKEDGEWKFYYPNGKIHAIVNFSDGIQQGDYFEYNEDETLKAQYYFRDGKAGYSDELTKLSEKALSLTRKFENEEAIKVYDQAIKLNPTVAQLYFNRGVTKSNSFDFDSAIKDYDKAIEINPDYMEAYGNRGNAKINIRTSKGNIDLTKEETKSACEDFKKSVSLGDSTMATEDNLYLYCREK
ncbi:tetratricopeptide repeat protein [Chryseobacterium koreense]|uniref:tetratricopeptide repeat protein n=1 Tax=Chryseobacterium koreense TaxID=232216 RepID=UPI000A039154|nr:tetratricopeptide repeat protein [Chryseobacterium koreense]MBB5332289.1 antitoxin component YwqK of YwqJK toxin-antitoxin module [Chryseobacterium koreense]